MKKLVILTSLLSCFALNSRELVEKYQVPINSPELTKHYQAPINSPTLFAKELYRVQSDPDVSKFENMLNQAVKKFTKAEFTQFIMTTNDLGYTFLMHAAAIGDLLQIAYIFKALKEVYGNDQQSIFNYVNFQDKKIGYTALLFAVDSGRIADIKALVEPTAALLKGNKKLFLTFLNTSDYENENNPIILLTFDSSTDALKYLVLKAAEFFGQGSKEFWRFINYTDNDQGTALLYANNKPDEQIFLKKMGGVILKKQPKEILAVHALGQKLLDSMWTNDFNRMKKIMNFALERYGRDDQKALFYEFINSVDASGSDALIRASAQGNMEFVTFLLDSITKRFKNDGSYSIYNLLRNSTNNGKTALYLAIQQRHFAIGKLLLKTIAEYAPNKYFFYIYLNRKDQINHFPALILTVYNSTVSPEFFNMTETILKAMAQYFKPHTREYDVFINEWDQNGYTALDYANTEDVAKLLKKYGAVDATTLQKEEVVFKKVMCSVTEACSPELSYFIPQHPSNSTAQSIITNNPKQTAHQLYLAQKSIDTSQFEKILKTAAKNYNPKQFWEFLNTRNEIGWTALMVAAAYSDSKQLNLILNTLRSYYKNNPMPIFNYLTSTDQKDGYTALLLASNRGALEITYTLLDFAAAIFGHNKQLFYQFIVQPNLSKEDNPLVLMTWDNASHGMTYLLKKAAEVLGSKSQLFKNFINWKDNNRAAAIEYATNPSNRELLKSYGATNKFQKDPINIEATEYNKKLLAAIDSSNFEKVQKVVNHVLEHFKGNDDAIFTFLSSHDNDGWDPLAHAATSGNIQIVHYLLSMIKHHIKDPAYILDTLTNIDKDGRTILTLSIQRKYFDIAKLVLDEIKHLYNDPTNTKINPYSLHMFVTFEDELSGASALMTAAKQSSDNPETKKIMYYLVNLMANMYGKQSRAYDLFINDEDFNGYTALDYADDSTAEFLKKNGARHGSAQKKRQEYKAPQKKLGQAHTEKKEPTFKALPQEEPTQTNGTATTIAEQLFDSMDLKDLTTYKKILTTAAKTESKENFFKLLSSRNKDGLTPLLTIVKLSDGEQLAILLKTIGEVFKNDPDAVFNILSQTTSTGQTPLTVAGNRGAKVILNPLINFAIASFGDNKKRFFTFITQPDTTNEFNPIISLAWNNNAYGLHYLVQRAAQVLGKNSERFKQFINWQDNDGFTMLDYIKNPSEAERTQKEFGAKIGPHSKDPIKREAAKMNIQLLNALLAGNKKLAKKIINLAVKKFGNNEDPFFIFLGNKDQYGWSPLAHVIMDGDKELINYIFTIMAKVFKSQTFQYAMLSNIDRYGRSLLHSTLERKDFWSARLILEEMKRLLKEGAINKYTFHNAVTFLDENRGLSPLINLIINSQDNYKDLEMINYYLKTMANIYGINSRAFDRIVNEKDYVGYSALDYANTPKVIQLLKSYGVELGTSGAGARPESIPAAPHKGTAPEKGGMEKGLEQKLALTTTERAAKVLFTAQQNDDLVAFKKILNQIADTFTKEEFVEILNRFDDIGLTLLLNAIGMSDIDQLTIILDTIKTKFKGDKKAIYKVLSQESKIIGYPPFLTAASRGMPEIITLLLNFAEEVYQGDKDLFYQFITQPDKNHEDSPLTTMAWNNTSISMRILLNKAAKVLGKGTPQFLHFINWVNATGSTALQGESNEKDRKLLEEYGAQPGPKREVEPLIIAAHAANKQVSNAIKNGKTHEAKKLIDAALKQFGNNEDTFLEFIDHKDEKGWPPLTYAVAQGNTELVDYIISIIGYYFNNPLFQYFALFNVDNYGKTLLHIGFEQNKYDLSRKIIVAVKKMYDEKKIDRMLFHMFITFRDEIQGISPLMSAVIHSSGKASERAAIEYLLKVMAEIFRINSRGFVTFINAKDFSGKTALDYAKNDSLKTLLKKYGAKEG